MNRQVVRIIGGKHRGKKLYFEAIDAANSLRPTTNRIKETLFNWLRPYINGAYCLDAFAGSGSLGFEAYSQGAALVVLLESSQLVSASIRKIAQTLHTNNLLVIHTNAEDYLVRSKEKFNIIFLDPPFASNHLEQCLKILSSSQLLITGGLVYLESSRSLRATPPWQEIKSKHTGNVYYSLWEKGL